MDQKFINLQINLHGQEGLHWIDKLPEIVTDLKNKWDLKIGEEFELSYNYVVSATRKARENAVLKIYFPEDPEYENQLNCLKVFNGDGAIKVLDYDNEKFAILLEQAIPGKTLSSLNDEEKETLIFCNTVKKLWKKPEVSNFENISKDLNDFDWYFNNSEKCKDLDFETVKKAQDKFKSLVDSQKDLYLLHSDLHHENILESKRGWLAIDPKGVIGEREYEITAFMRNPIKRAENNLLTKDILLKRLEIITKELNLNRQRIIDWSFAQTILSVIWSFQSDSNRVDYWYKIAKELENLE